MEFIYTLALSKHCLLFLNFEISAFEIFATQIEVSLLFWSMFESEEVDFEKFYSLLLDSILKSYFLPKTIL